MIKYRFLKSLTPEVACYRRRLLSTSVARDVPNVSKKSSKKVPKAVRKAMVYDFVQKYRAINDGKFPGTQNTMDQVGGSFYIIKAILQELEYNSKLSAPVSEAVHSVTSIDKIAEPKDFGDLSKNSIHCLEKIDNDNSDEKLMEKTAPDRILMEPEMDNSRIHEKSNLPSEGPVLSSTMSVEINEASAQAPEVRIFIVPSPENTNKQDDISMLPAVENINEEKGKQTADVNQISEVREALDCQVSMDGTDIKDNGGVSAKTGFNDEKISSSPSSITDGKSRFTVPDPESTKKQDGESMPPAVEIINEEKGRHTAEADQTSLEGTVWGNMKSMARKFINIWRT